MKKKPIQNVRRRQYLAYLLILMIAGTGSSWAYHLIHGAHVALHQAEKHFARQDYTGAIPLYRKAMEDGLIRDWAVRHLVEAYSSIGEEKSAILYLESLARQHGEPTTVLSLAGLYESEGRWADIISLLHPYTSQRPESLSAARRLADAYRNTGSWKKAEHWYRSALAVRPESVFTRFRLAEVLAWTHQYDEAIGLFRSILQTAPEHRPSRLYLARVLAWNGQLEEAIVQYRILLGDTT